MCWFMKNELSIWVRLYLYMFDWVTHVAACIILWACLHIITLIRPVPFSHFHSSSDHYYRYFDKFMKSLEYFEHSVNRKLPLLNGHQGFLNKHGVFGYCCNGVFTAFKVVWMDTGRVCFVLLWRGVLVAVKRVFGRCCNRVFGCCKGVFGFC